VTYLGYIVVYKTDVDASTITSHVTEVSSLLSRRDLLSAIGAKYDLDHLKGYQITADVAAIAEIAASPLVFDPGILQFFNATVVSGQMSSFSSIKQISLFMSDPQNYLIY
jgi:hypothetical protein